MVKELDLSRLISVRSLSTVIAATLCLSVLSVPPAHADESGAYLAIGAGYSDDRAFDESDTGFKLAAGYEFNPYAGIELSYVDFGDTELDGGPVASSADGIGLGLVVTWPASERIDMRFKVGAFNWSGEITGIPLIGDIDDSGTDAFFGLGLQFAATEHVNLGIEWERYEGVEYDLVSAYVGFRF